MQYLCKKQLIFGEKTYYPGDIIPDGVVFPERSIKLLRNKCIEEINGNAMAELAATEPGAFENDVVIEIKGENGDIMALPVKPEEVKQVFSILQLNAEEGTKAISEVKSENILILVHAADSRKTIKEAAKKQADNLFSNKGDTNEASKRNETTDTITEGANA